MIPFMRGGKFGWDVSWRQWAIGFNLGPEVWAVYVGPLSLWFDPEGLHDPKGRDDV